MFILGVGAPKTGTTWLAAYIRQSPRYVRFCEEKEQHVWDRVCIPLMKGRKRKLRRILPGLLRTPGRRWDRLRQYIALWLMEKIPAYYFYRLQRTLRNKENITLDITPAYMGLSKEDFIKIRNGLKKYDIRTKVVFLMRDPVEKCISHYKSISYRHLNTQGKGTLEKPAPYWWKEVFHLHGSASALADTAGLKKYCTLAETRFKTSYQDTIANLEAVFAPEQLFFGIYENLFEEQSIAALSDSLELPYNPAFAKRCINSAFAKRCINPNLIKHIDVDVDDDTRRFIAEEYRSTYAFCATRFPVTRKLWGGFQWLDRA